MRKCRKCKKNPAPTESRKYCDECLIKPATCECGKIFRSTAGHRLCKNCRNIKGNEGKCATCGKDKHLYWSSGVCNTCYRKLSKYKIDKKALTEIKKITHCQLCNIELEHGNQYHGGVIDHCHETGEVRGYICQKCNIIEGMIRDQEHLDNFYSNYTSYIMGRKMVNYDIQSQK
jgi:hypothetical protein